MPDKARDHVRANYDAFVAQLPELLKTHPGKFALMRDGAVVEFFDTARDAFAAGLKLYQGQQLFSVQEVVDAPVNLGFFSHAVS